MVLVFIRVDRDVRPTGAKETVTFTFLTDFLSLADSTGRFVDVSLHPSPMQFKKHDDNNMKKMRRFGVFNFHLIDISDFCDWTSVLQSSKNASENHPVRSTES